MSLCWLIVAVWSVWATHADAYEMGYQAGLRRGMDKDRRVW